MKSGCITIALFACCVTAGAGLLFDAEGGAEGGGGGVQSSGTAEPGMTVILAAFLYSTGSIIFLSLFLFQRHHIFYSLYHF